MRAIVVPSGVKRPFAPIDRSIVRALRRLDVDLTIVLPGKQMNACLQTAVKQAVPDFIFVLMGWRLGKRNYALLKKLRNIPKVVWFTDDPYYMDWSRTVGKHFDVVFTNESRSVPVYRRNGCQRVYHLPLGVDTDDFFPRHSVPQRFQSDVLVLGTAFNNRIKFMQQLLPHLSRTRVRLIGPGWEKLHNKSKIKVAVHPKWVTTKDVNAYYNGANIVLNLQRSPRDEYLKLNRGNVPANTPNNRTFEAAACSAFQLVEARADLPSLYPPEANMPAFHTPRSCLTLLNNYLQRENHRREVADKVYQYTLQSHQYVHRLQTVLKHIREQLLTR